MPKIARLSRECVITEKLDGTNAQIFIDEETKTVRAASKNRWITPEDDNYGFARWVEEHREELLQLGPGRHFGEWWGRGIQRNYGLPEKRFSLFNVHRWDPFFNLDTTDHRPDCCYVVPVLWRGEFDTCVISTVLKSLEQRGSVAVTGFMDPEGIVIYHTASKTLFKKTIKNDNQPKGKNTSI